MSELSLSGHLYRRLTKIRWQAPLLALIFVIGHQLIEHTWLRYLPHWQHFASQVLFYGLAGPFLVWWALTYIRRRVAETQAVESALSQAHSELHESNQRLELLIKVDRRLAGADDEEALVNVIMALPLEVIPAIGCSLIFFDDRKHPLPAIHRGDLDPVIFDSWARHLSTADMHAACPHCHSTRATDADSCPLLIVLGSESPVCKVHSLSLTRGEREYGVLNIYLKDVSQPDSRQQMLLEAMAGEMALALESQRLRTREMSALYHPQPMRKLSDLKSELSDILARLAEALEVDGGVLFLTHDETSKYYVYVEGGEGLGEAQQLVRGIAEGSRHSEAPLVIRDLDQDGSSRRIVASLLIAPVRVHERTLGSVALWASRSNSFPKRRVRLLATLAAQMGLMVENHRLYIETDHRAALAERARLAREIHDGLAQTLGYLNMRTAQIRDWLGADDVNRAKSGLDEVRSLLHEAQIDVREAIDGLRMQPGTGTLQAWLSQISKEFEGLSPIRLEVAAPPSIALRPEVQSQLLRIVQEALSNVRKHSDATRAWLNWQADECWLTMYIIDNGQGFDPDDVPPIARHGLHIMQERAELLDADFQIVSRPTEGTRVILRLPLRTAVEA